MFNLHPVVFSSLRNMHYLDILFITNNFPLVCVSPGKSCIDVRQFCDNGEC